ncbi:MAG TPA: hypothetical protein VKR32_12110 [Puia sp.]|nr:hypothetical protein [Puia sp.]
MRIQQIALFALVVSIPSCKQPSKPDATATFPEISGTWQLFEGITITKGESVTTDYTKKQRMIKVINGTHFAFLKHDVDVPKDSSLNFDAGGGSYDLQGDQYTEHLDFYNDRNWQGKSFRFTISINKDTLTQKGLEKVEGTGINREIIEKYVRIGG